MSKLLFIFVLASLLLISPIFAGTGDAEFDFNYRVNSDLFKFWPSQYFRYTKNQIIVMAHIKYSTPWHDSDGQPMIGKCSILKQFSGNPVQQSFDVKFSFFSGQSHNRDYYSMYNPADLAGEYAFLGSIERPGSIPSQLSSDLTRTASPGVLKDFPNIEVLMTPDLELEFSRCNMDKVIECNREYVNNVAALQRSLPITTSDPSLKEDGIVAQTRTFQNDPVLAFYQTELYIQEGLITKPDTFDKLLALFPSRALSRALEQFASFYGSQPIIDSLYEKLSREVIAPETSRSRLVDIRILIESGNKWTSNQQKALKDKVMAALHD